MSSKCCWFGSKSSVKSENEHLCERSELREEAEVWFQRSMRRMPTTLLHLCSFYFWGFFEPSRCSVSSPQIRSSTFWRRVCPISRRDRVVGHELSHRLCTSLKAEAFSCPLDLFLTPNQTCMRHGNACHHVLPASKFGRHDAGTGSVVTASCTPLRARSSGWEKEGGPGWVVWAQTPSVTVIDFST